MTNKKATKKSTTTKKSIGRPKKSIGRPKKVLSKAKAKPSKDKKGIKTIKGHEYIDFDSKQYQALEEGLNRLRIELDCGMENFDSMDFKHMAKLKEDFPTLHKHLRSLLVDKQIRVRNFKALTFEKV